MGGRGSLSSMVQQIEVAAQERWYVIQRINYCNFTQDKTIL